MLTFILNSIAKSTSNDMHVNAPHDWQFGFQTPYSPVMEGIIRFHDDLMIFLTFILFFVLYIMYSCLNNFSTTGVAHNKKRIFSVFFIYTSPYTWNYLNNPSSFSSRSYCDPIFFTSLFNWWNCRTFIYIQSCGSSMILIIWNYVRKWI